MISVDTLKRLRRRVLAQCVLMVPFSARYRQALPPLFGQVGAARLSLEDTVRAMEGRFLEISTTIENITRTGQELVDQGEALIALAIGQGGGQITIEETAEHIWDAIAFVERSVANGDRLIDQLTASTGQIKSILTAEQTLARTLSPLTYVQTLFRVESARCVPEVQTMFQALVHEIDRVRESVENGFREKFQLIREIQGILDRTIGQLQTRQAEAREAVSTLHAQLTLSLDTMKASYEKNRDRDTRLASESQAVARATGQVVMSLQFFDILTQKLQHIYQIIGDMEAHYQVPVSSRDEAARMLRRLQQSGQICGAQLAATEAELDCAGQAINDGLNKITVQMANLDTECIALSDIDSVTTGVDGAVQILFDSLGAVQQLVHSAEQQTIETHQAIAPIGGMTSNFTSFIRQLSYEIQLIGLNAEVQAAHVGAGTGLEVLSAQTSAISRETSRLNTDLAIELDTLTGRLDQVVESFGRTRRENVAYSQQLGKTIEKDKASLHDYRDSALKVIQHLSDLLPKLEEQIQIATSTADFTSLAQEPLRRLRAACTTLATTAQTHADSTGVRIENTQLTDHLLKLYTMRSEVDVHHATLAPDNSLAALPAIKPEDKLDLWGEAGTETSSPPEAAATPPPTGEIELFGDEPATAAGTPTPVPAIAAPAPSAIADVDLWLDEPAASREPDQRQSA